MITLKYPITVGKKHWPKGTEVRDANLEEVQSIWPRFDRTYNMLTFSGQSAVVFPDMSHCTLVDESDLTRE